MVVEVLAVLGTGDEAQAACEAVDVGKDFRAQEANYKRTLPDRAVEEGDEAGKEGEGEDEGLRRHGASVSRERGKIEQEG